MLPRYMIYTEAEEPMEKILAAPLSPRQRGRWEAFLTKQGLDADPGVEVTLLLEEDGQIIATGSRQENILKCIAVDPAHQGEDLSATVLTELRQEAFHRGLEQLFLYTKPKNRLLFESLFFYPVAQTQDVLLMENRRGGIADFVSAIPRPEKHGNVGAVVMNCNPFTLGHRYLVETAARACDWLYVFVLSEEKSLFSAEDRLRLVKEGTADLSNVTVWPTGPYLISSATFPTYFLPDKSRTVEIQCRLDLEVFARHFAPPLFITRRYVGREPFSQVTAQYNRVMKEYLPAMGIQVTELPRKEGASGPISASAVRALLGSGQRDKLRTLVPESTFRYLEINHLI